MKTLLRISSFAVSVGVLAMLGCETGEDPEELDSDTASEARITGSYNTIQECKALFHPGNPGDGWVSFCDRHGGWGNPNAAAAGMTCKKIDCERNASHDLSVHFFQGGCYCKDGYKGPDPDEDLDPLPPGCEDAKRGRITFCQKSETCRGTGTRTLKGYSCRDVNNGFAALVCSGMFSDNDWKKMRADCCFGNSDSCPSDPRKTQPGVCGCGIPDTDSDGDKVLDCRDGCPSDPNKTQKGTCGCGTSDRDSDGDGTADCRDECPSDPNKTQKGTCGCGKREGTCNTCVDQLTYCSSFKSHCSEPPFQKYCCATCKVR